MLVIIVGNPYIGKARCNRLVSIERLRDTIDYDSSLYETIYFTGNLSPEMKTLAMQTRQSNQNFVIDVGDINDVPVDVRVCAHVVIMTDIEAAEQTLAKFPDVNVYDEVVRFTFTDSTQPFLMLDRRVSPNRIKSCSN